VVEGRTELFRPRARLRLLDLLRLVAALSVVLFHYTARYSTAWSNPTPQDLWAPLSSATAYGALGVQLFFMISGFVVLMTAWGSDMGAYAASRISRLYPAYWAGVLITGAFLFFDRTISIGGSWSSVGPSGYLLNFTMLQTAFGVPNIEGVYWTLWVELKFYLLIGLLVLVGVTRRRILLLSVAWPLLAAFMAQFRIPIADELLMPEFAPFFSAGMVLYVMYREGWSLLPAVALVFNWIVMMHHAFKTAPFTITLNTDVPANPNVVAVVYTSFIAVILLITQTRLSDVSWKWLTVAGALTYPLYLIHEIPGWWLISKLYPALPKTVVLAIVLAVMLVAAYLINRYVERLLGPRMRRALNSAFSGARRPVDAVRESASQASPR
jgi:peptidoglycan/LPS O-acetylase OafA/YrhL